VVGRDIRWKGHDIGPTLLIEAIRLVSEVADRIGILGVHLRSTPGGERLYKDFEFKQFSSYPFRDTARFILSTKDVRAIAARVQELLH